MKEMARNGATVLGGCCGTTPEHIHKTKLVCDAIPSVRSQIKDGP